MFSDKNRCSTPIRQMHLLKKQTSEVFKLKKAIIESYGRRVGFRYEKKDQVNLNCNKKGKLLIINTLLK